MASSNSIPPLGVASNANGNSNNGGYNVFVYGSLLADDVVRVLLHRIPQASPSTLHGYSAALVTWIIHIIHQRACLSAILPVENKKVTGRVLMGITAPELDILDKFEDFEYEKRAVDVSLLDTSEVLQAYTYVWAKSDDPNLYGEWDFKVWKESKMKDFVNMTMGFVEEQDSKPRVATYESYYDNKHKE
ncbi:hypothetical protein OSB04_029922 [Centaurea solstitialis]|uniref:Putative gamma-glutamylcyclotransferase n=1 Tax=Centaurea solstitialis TaxID=347529 RepID=A0AA38S7S7_9ASTR|nr:hypothetical protein OSB04_029922 [Centaurea solstitialis]